MREHILNRSDIRRRQEDGQIFLQYRGKVKKRVARLYGQDEDTFFAITPSSIRVPDDVEQLARESGYTLIGSDAEAVIQKLVAEALIAKAIEEAPHHIETITGTRFQWSDGAIIPIERETRLREEAVNQFIRLLRARLTLRITAPLKTLELSEANETPQNHRERHDHAPPDSSGAARTKAGANSDTGSDTGAVADPSQENRDTGGSRWVPSAKVLRSIQESCAKIRDLDIPQRLPAGARKAIEKMPAGIVSWHDGSASRFESLASAMEKARTFKGECAVIDWDGEQPVLIRKFADGVVTYRCEDGARTSRQEESQTQSASSSSSEPKIQEGTE